ncbi:MAG: hypothetical protein O2970_11520 [Proteobacteria bacterium]|nr:hypothetical protein [Pseudomonadota bacterium]
MPRYDWFEHIKLSGTRHRRDKDALRKAIGRGTEKTYKPKAIKKSTYYKIHKNRYGKFSFGNFKTDTYRLIDLANIYGIHVNTVLDWYRRGMLPDSKSLSSDKYRGWGWAERPIYIKEQILVITKVLDDIFAQSNHFRIDYKDHIQMMREGDIMVRSRIPYKAVYTREQIFGTPKSKPKKRKPKTNKVYILKKKVRSQKKLKSAI